MAKPAEINIVEDRILSDNWYILRKITYDKTTSDNHTVRQVREVYDRGNGATILLYNQQQQTVILTRQFRLPTYVNGNDTGMLIETCAGLLDKDNPEAAIRRETEEETGYQIGTVKKVFEAYMSPGSVTEILYFFVAPYTKEMKVSEGGGLKKTKVSKCWKYPTQRRWKWSPPARSETARLSCYYNTPS